MKRIKYIDILRGWAVLLMVFWHLTEALISNNIRGTTIFYISQFVGGLVAPMFLFTAGASSAILMFKKRESFVGFTADFKKRIIRISLILFVAYLLHFPEKNIFSVILSRSGEAYLHFVKTDVLQVIAVGLLFLHFLFLLIKNSKVYFYFVLIIGILFIVLTPYVWLIDFGKFFPVEIATYFNPAYYSLFPVFPWLAYLLLGATIMQLALENQNNEGAFLKRIFISGIIMIVFGLIAHLAGIKTSINYNFWATSINIFMIKLGIVFIIMYFLSVINEKLNYEMKIFKTFSSESLFIYVTHLLLIYGGRQYTLQTIFGRTLNWLELAIIYLIMIFALLFVAKGWTKLKQLYRLKFNK
jgi:uncharacterized membrane protein